MTPACPPGCTWQPLFEADEPVLLRDSPRISVIPFLCSELVPALRSNQAVNGIKEQV
jgi:hypothetical protein